VPDSSPAGAGMVRRVRRNSIYIAVFLMDVGMASGTMAFTYIAKEDFGATPGDLGLFALIAAGTYVVASLLLGRLADRWGRKRNIVMACLIASSVYALAPHAERLWQLYVLGAVFSIGQGAFWPAIEADISDNSAPRELPRRLGRFNVAWCSGFAIAGLVAGSLGEYLDQVVVLSVSGCFALLALPAYLLRTYEPERLPVPEPDECTARRARTRAGAFWKIALILNFAAMGLNGSLRFHMPTVTGGEHSALGGAFLAAMFGAEVLTFIVLARWHGWHYRAAPVAAGWGVALTGGLLCALGWRSGIAGPECAPLLFGAGCVLIGVGCGMIYYSSIYYSVAAESDRGARGGIHESVLGLGAAVIPWIGGLLAGVSWAGGRLPWKAGTPFLTAAVILAAALPVTAWIYLRARAVPASSAPAPEPELPTKHQ